MTPVAETYRTLADRFDAVVTAVPTDRWDAASPCEDWTAGDVVDHVVTSTTHMLEQAGFDPPATDDLDRPAAFAAVRGAVEDVLTGPDAEREYDGHFGRTTFAATMNGFFAPDLVLHRWDLARATGQTDAEAISDDEVALVRERLEPLGDNLRSPGAFGPALDVPDDADEQTTLLAFAGRRA